MPSQRLSTEIAIVTGSSSGIGRAIALAFHREGAVVICSDITEKARNRNFIRRQYHDSTI